MLLLLRLLMPVSVPAGSKPALPVELCFSARRTPSMRESTTSKQRTTISSESYARIGPSVSSYCSGRMYSVTCCGGVLFDCWLLPIAAVWSDEAEEDADADESKTTIPDEEAVAVVAAEGASANACEPTSDMRSTLFARDERELLARELRPMELNIDAVSAASAADPPPAADN